MELGMAVELEMAEVGFLPGLPILRIPELSRSLLKIWVCL